MGKHIGNGALNSGEVIGKRHRKKDFHIRKLRVGDVDIELWTELGIKKSKSSVFEM